MIGVYDVMKRNLGFENLAQAYLELLSLRGVDCFFANAGTEFAPLEDAFARRLAEGKLAPRPLSVPHEIPLVSMAHGYYLVTGRPQVAMVHVVVGTANAMGPLMAASRGRIPMLFSAGRTPVTEAGDPASRSRFIHWGQESFDQAGVLREYVKWDYELRTASQLESVVDRALSMAMTEPRGPVYLVLPRELLSAPAGTQPFMPRPRLDLPTFYPEPNRVERAAQLLAQAKFPLVITSSLGRTPSAVRALAGLAEVWALGVVSFNPEYMNFPLQHPCHLGFNPEPFLEKADVLFVVDCDVPWYPSRFRPPDRATIVQVGVDPFYSRYPVRSFPSDLTVQGAPETIFSEMSRILGSEAAKNEKRLYKRRESLRKRHDSLMRGWIEAAHRVSRKAPLDPRWVSYQVSRVVGDETIVVNEHDQATKELISPGPGGFFSTIHVGYLGWAMGAALGIKLARPERTVMVTIGDGCYLFGVPSACHFVSSAYRLPVLIVVYNNRCYHAVKRGTLSLHPKGWAARTGRFVLSELDAPADYEKICEAFGGYGERVESPDQVEPALQRALYAVRKEKRQALLNMVLDRP